MEHYFGICTVLVLPIYKHLCLPIYFGLYCHSVQIYNFPHILHIFLLALLLIFCTFITECVEMQLTLGFGLFILLNSLTILASSFFGVFYMDNNFICCPRPLAPISFSYSDHWSQDNIDQKERRWLFFSYLFVFKSMLLFYHWKRHLVIGFW